MDVRKTVLVAHSAEQMFDIIEAAERYPDFLPWCAAATIIARSDAEVVADIGINFHGVRFAFRTRNPKRRPEWMAIHLEHGPFRHFGGTWNLAPLAADGCRIDFALSYDFESTPMARLARPVFARIANTLVDRFVARADLVCPRYEAPAANDVFGGRDEPPQRDVRFPGPSGASSVPEHADTLASTHSGSAANRSDPT